MAPIPLEPPRRKALLIGINYEEGDVNGTLEGSHINVQVLRKLLIEVYGYKSEDIVCMIDSEAVQEYDLRPTCFNILKAIDSLVTGARAGDHLFFYYSGHSGQVTNRNNSEEDGKDEVIITSDGKDLVDNQLRARLVDTLPVGSNLVAVLDTCHSGSLLDLQHHRCNRVYIPHVSKGYRKTDPRWNRNVRHQAMIVEVPMEWHHEPTGLTFYTEESVIIRAMSSDSPGPSPQPRTRELPEESRSSRSSWPSKIDVTLPVPHNIFPIMTRCDSPTPVWECDGFCRNKLSLGAEETPHVISISACKDAQVTWESPGGKSLTVVLVSILRKDPHPSLEDLMYQLSAYVHEQARMLHEDTNSYKKERKLRRKGRLTSSLSREQSDFGEKDNFWDPQMASLRPLDMRATFIL